MLVSLPQAATHHSQEQQAKVRAALQERHKITVVENQQVAVRHSRRISGAFFAIKQGNFAEHLPRSDHREHDLSPGR